MFLSLLLLRPVSPAVFGVDFGSQFIKLSMALFGKGVHVAINQQSKRLSPATFAFFNTTNPKNTTFPDHWQKDQLKECSWLFCDQAENHGRRFPQNIVKGLNDLHNNTHGLKRREILALTLKHLISTADESRWKVNEASLVFAVEPWMPRSQRFAIREAVKLSGANLLSILDSPTAVAINYALEKQSFFINGSKTVAFIDLGAAHTWISVYNFTHTNKKQIAQQLSVSADMSLGGDFIDKALAEHLKSIFAEKHGIQPPYAPRVEAMFLAEARRVKERLTINQKVDVYMEDVIGEYELTTSVTRETFDELIKELRPAVHKLFDDVAAKANLTINEIDSIELLGGLSRVPLLMDSIREWSGMEKLNRTLNSDEAIAIGAGYDGASKSGSFIIKPVSTNPFADVNVSAIFDFNESVPIFNESSRMTDTITLTFNATEVPKNITMEIEGDAKFFTYSIEVPQNFENETINVTFGFDQFTFPVVKKAICNGTRLNITRTPADWMESSNATAESISFINKLDNVLFKRHQFQAVKSDHESLIYQIRDRLESDAEFINATSDEEKQNMRKTVTEQLEWLSNTTRKTVKEFRSNLNALRDLIRKPDIRIFERGERPYAMEKLNKTIATVRDALKSLPQTKPWLTEQQLNGLELIFNSTRDWFEEKSAGIAAEKPYDDPCCTTREIEWRWDALDTRLRQVKSIPRPTPTPTPRPATNATHSNATHFNATNVNFTSFNATEFNFTEINLSDFTRDTPEAEAEAEATGNETTPEKNVEADAEKPTEEVKEEEEPKEGEAEAETEAEDVKDETEKEEEKPVEEEKKAEEEEEKKTEEEKPQEATGDEL